MLPLLYCNGNDIIFCFLIVSIIGKLVIFLLEFFLIQIPFSNFYVYVLLDISSFATAVMGSLTPVQKEEKFLSTQDLLEKIYKNSENDREKIKEILGKMDILKDQLDEVLRYNKALENQNNLLYILIQQLFSELEKRNEKK